MMFLRTVFAGSLMVAAVAASAEDWRGWNIHVEDYPVSHGMERFAELVEERTDGALNAKTFHSGVLGSQPDAIEQVRLGVIDFGVFNLGPMGQAVPEANVTLLPFIFKDVPTMYALMDGEIGAAIGEGMKARGIVPIGWYGSGARSFYNTEGPILTPDDVVGMKVRVMNNDLFVGMIEAMGGNATPMAFAEVYQALRTGVVDGAENNPPSYESTNHFEVAQYYSLSEHLIIPECLCVSLKSWESLSPEVQEIVLQAGKESADYQRELWQAREDKSLEAVRAGNVEINVIEDKAAFQTAMAPVYEQFTAANPDLAALVDQILAAQ